MSAKAGGLNATDTAAWYHANEADELLERVEQGRHDGEDAGHLVGRAKVHAILAVAMELRLARKTK